MEPADTFEHAGLTVRICYDEYGGEGADPRDQDGNLGVMFCDHPDYDLGDEGAPDPRGQTVTCERCEGHEEIEIGTPQPPDQPSVQTCPLCEGNGEIELSIVEYLKREHGARVILPLFLYDHSGITMRTGGRLDTGEDNLVSRNRFMGDAAGWDTSTVGVIFDTADKRKEFGLENWSDEKILKNLEEEIVYYAAYLEGAVYGFQIVAADGEVLDSCWGFLEPSIWHEDSYVRTAAREAAEDCAEEIKDEQREAHEWACRDVVTV